MAKSLSKKILKYTVIFEPAEEGGYVVSVPSLPGCVSQGETFEEATAMIKDAISLYLEDLEADGEKIPSDNGSAFVGQVEINRNKSQISP